LEFNNRIKKNFSIFDQKSKFETKIEVLVKNGNFGEKWKFWGKMEMLVKIEILLKNRNSGQKSKFWSKIEMLVKNTNFGQKSKFRSIIEFLSKNRNSDKKKFRKKLPIGWCLPGARLQTF